MAKYVDKDAYYFPHFCNARHDRKIKRLRMQLGVEGYGIFFMLLEVLREQSEYRFPLEDVDLLADEFGTSKEKVSAVIEGYDLFEIDEENHFFSSNLIVYLTPYFKGKESKIVNGLKGNLIRYGHLDRERANKMSNESIIELAEKHNYNIESIFSLSDRLPVAKRSQNDRKSSQSKVNESKVNESKVNESKVNESKVNESKASDRVTKVISKRQEHDTGYIIVPVAESIHGRLVEKYGIDTINHYYDKIADYADSKGKTYSDYAATARNWISLDEKKGIDIKVVKPKKYSKHEDAIKCPQCIERGDDQPGLVTKLQPCWKCGYDLEDAEGGEND